MKLTPRCQGFRFTHKAWSIEKYIDVLKVGKGRLRQVEGINERGEKVVIYTLENSSDWVKIPKR